MTRYALVSLLLVAGSASAAQVDMLFLFNTGLPGYYVFDIDGTVQPLICDQFLPNVTTQLYTANVASLASLAGSVLAIQGDPFALSKYQKVAILDSLAFANPSDNQLATDVTWANRRIVDGAGPLPGNAQTLYDWVQTQNPAAYDLTGFRIYTPFDLAESQEQTGFPGGNQVPEPAEALLTGIALAGLALVRRGRRRAA